MLNEKYLDMIRQGKIQLNLGEDGLPIQAHEPMFERMLFLSALARGYIALYNRCRFLEYCQTHHRRREEGEAS